MNGTPVCWRSISPKTPSATTSSGPFRADGLVTASAVRSRKGWLVPNTRQSVVKIGQLFGKDHCRFDEAIVRLYKPTATTAEVEQATNPPWPPVGRQQPTGSSARRKPFRYAPPVREYDQHPVIMAVSDALRVQQYSYKTYKNYKQALIALIRYVNPEPLDELTKPQYQKYLLFLVDKKRHSPATLNVHINAWKFYQEKVLQRDKEFYDVTYPRQAVKLPTVYSVEEVKAIFRATTSLKYRTLFQLVYATGVRVGEVAALRITDLDRIRRLITIRGGKGKKDRIVMFSEKLEATLSEYVAAYKPNIYLFEEAQPNEPLMIRTIQLVYAQTTHAAGIRKRGRADASGYPHITAQFCHSFARSGLGYSLYPTTAWARKYSDDHALYPRNGR